MISGESQFHLSGGSPGAGCGWMSITSPLARSKRARLPYCDWE